MPQKVQGLITLSTGLLLAAAGCDALLNATASLGGATAGQRGNARVLFINNTPFRAIFMFGAYDNLDQDTQPQIQQFSSQNINLGGDSQSNVLTIPCSRVFSIGGAGLLLRVQENLMEGQFNEDLLFEGVRFSSAGVGDDNADEATEGVAPPMDAFIGADFECNSLLIYRFEINDLGPDPFAIELTTIPSESTR